MTDAVRTFSALGRHRGLLLELTKREILGRYRGATMGMLWSVISPFLMLMVYTLAFGYVMKSRWPGADGSTTGFSLILFVGLIVHGFFAECIIRAPQLIISNTSYVKRVVFPLETLTWVMTLSALFHLGMNVLVLLLLKVVLREGISWTVILFPVVMLPLVLLTIGVSWILAALGVYLRDISQVVGVLASAMLFLSSAIVPVHTLPQSYQWVFRVNPLTLIIDQAREVMLWGRPPDWGALAIYSTVAVAVFLLGFRVFQRMRGGFADVL